MTTTHPRPDAGGPRTYRRATHLAWRRVVEETVVLDLRARVLFGLSSDAAAVLAELARPQDAAELARRLAGVAEVSAIVAELAAAGLVEVCPEGTAPSADGFGMAAGPAGLAAHDAVPVADGEPASTLPGADRAAPGASEPAAAAAAIRWREQLAEVTHQFSPPMAIGNPQCLP